MAKNAIVGWVAAMAAVTALTAGCGGAVVDVGKEQVISTAAADSLVPGGLARGVALHTQIRSAGNECASVTKTFLQGMKDGDQVWDAECEGGKSYGVVSRANGTTEVLSCEAVEREMGTSCFEKF